MLLPGWCLRAACVLLACCLRAACVLPLCVSRLVCVRILWCRLVCRNYGMHRSRSSIVSLACPSLLWASACGTFQRGRLVPFAPSWAALSGKAGMPIYILSCAKLSRAKLCLCMHASRLQVANSAPPGAFVKGGGAPPSMPPGYGGDPKARRPSVQDARSALSALSPVAYRMLFIPLRIKSCVCVREK